jgi:ribonuclease Z
MKYDLIVISGNTPDSSPSVALAFATGVYLFNAPDQTQRIFREQKIRFQKLENIFLTSLHSRSIGGMQGLLITVFDTKGVNVYISAPEGIENILKTYRSLHTNEFLIPKIAYSVQDENISTKEIPLKMTMAFDVQLREVPGKFLIQKAKELQIPAGPLYRQLQDGNTITLSDGRVIEPSQVIGPSTRGDRLLFVECRCDEDIDMLPSCKDYDFVVHFTPLDILMQEKYLSKFDPSQRSIVFPENGRITFPSVSTLYSNIVTLSPALFKPLVHFDTKMDEIPKGFTHADGGLDYIFCPVEKKKFVIPKYEVSIPFSDPPQELPEFTSFKVTFTGTGSMYPSKYRNVPGILIHTKAGYVVLDAGEGFVGQLRRRFGKANVDTILKNIILIFISHNHGDHVFGVYQLLQERAQLVDTDVPLMCPEPVGNHMKALQEFSRFGSLRFEYQQNDMRLTVGCTLCEPIPVIHSKNSQGCVLTINGGYRIAYSGDRCVLDDFGAQVGGCDLMIHESTFCDDLVSSAAEKRHCTMGQAIQTAEQAGAKYVILTHFSQRYPKLPVFEGNTNVAFAFDYLSFRFEDMKDLCEVCPKIFRMIQELEEKEEEPK